MKLFQQEIQLSRRRGFHIITPEIVNALPQMKEISTGMCHIFIRHTSASLCINENAAADVRLDMENFFNRLVPEDDNWIHVEEGSDDMPAHIKAAMLGSSVTVPVRDGRLALGTWQGIYFCEHRDHGGPRRMIITAWGL